MIQAQKWMKNIFHANKAFFRLRFQTWFVFLKFEIPPQNTKFPFLFRILIRFENAGILVCVSRNTERK